MSREIVVIESGKDRSKFDLLDAALEEVRFDGIIDAVWRDSGKEKDEFPVLIKPNLAMFFKDDVIITDPELVEHLVDLLHGLGYTRVIVGEAQNAFSRWLENREIHKIARAAGYRSTTSRGRKYEVVDLSGNVEWCDFPCEYSLYGTPVSKDWKDAGFRISFAKNKTHEEYFYTLCLKNILGAISQTDKHLHYHSRLKVWDVCLEMVQQFTVHFNIIDAYLSSDGNSGAQVANPIETKTIIAGRNTILVDWAGALKMGLDPYVSPLNKKALESMGLPENYRIIGSLTPYENWKNVHPLISDFFFRLDEAEGIRHFLWPASFTSDAGLFPWKKRVYGLINKGSCLWAWTDKSPILQWATICLLYFVVFLFESYRAWNAVFKKDKLWRKELPIHPHRAEFTETDYEQLPEFIRPLEETIEALPRVKGSCHAFVDGGILYCLEQELDIAYEAFVNKMDICRAVTLMKDYIGGKTIKVKRDREGRCIHQLERTVFLPQPNLFVFLNAKDIDVTKIERIEYGGGFQKILWKTVYSDNGSARYDEGAVSFERAGCRTRVRIIVHQAFDRPYILRWFPLRCFPSLRRFSLLPPYHTFFRKTIENYRAAAEGNYRPIGRYRPGEESWLEKAREPCLE